VIYRKHFFKTLAGVRATRPGTRVVAAGDADMRHETPQPPTGEEALLSREHCPERTQILPVSRRRFVQGVGVGAVLVAYEGQGRSALGERESHEPSVLTGKHFDLTIDYLPVNFTGRRAVATAVNGSVPGPTLKWKEGDTITLAVTNRLKRPTSIHWHGMRIPADMDGVPGLSFPGIAPGETFRYQFPVKQSGTFWYHSHTRFQEQTGLHGALIVERQGGDPIEFDREYVVFLSDWSDTNPETIFSNLKEQSDYYNYHRRTVGTFFSDVRKRGLRSTVADRLAWGRMNMSPMDISDVTGATYTYLLNGNPPSANWTGLFQAGERIRLRFINGSSMTFFDVRVPGLKMTVVQADGNDVEPVTVDEFRIGVAETYDVIVQPQEPAAYTIFAQAEDRSGYARGTLAPRLGMSATVPQMDPRPVRTMTDMGMGNMSGMKTDHMPGMAPSGADRTTKKDMAGMKMHSPIGTPGEQDARRHPPKMEHRVANVNVIGKTPLPQPGPGVKPAFNGSHWETKLEPSNPVDLHVGPQVAMVSMHVEERLNEPGDGLNGNGRRVLTYADLRARYRGADGRPPTREVELHLTGNMERFIWGFNGEKFADADPIVLKLGERIRVVLVNDTMMEHPIHLHGLWSELENGHGDFNPYKHTIIVKPSERVSYLVSADTPGRWAYHCHLLYHMVAGMFRTVMVLP
jgi:CopA family copper-resistance protein